MQVVGVDFGTTNVRIATWDSEQAASPQPQAISILGNEPIMPAVVALQKQPDGQVSIVVGEDADGMADKAGSTLVIRNIKRLALSTDPYVNWHLGFRNSHEKTNPVPTEEEDKTWHPKWWDPATLCVKEFGREFPVWELVGSILTEAFQRAGISGDYEWRAGCPVHADFLYRKGLADTLNLVTGKAGNIHWIVEEPFLFLLAARVTGDLPEGSYLLYDVGGGSFDCAVAEIKDDKTQIYGADGHPSLGGSDIDEWLDRELRKKGHSVQLSSLRQAKETLGNNTPFTDFQDPAEQRESFITLDNSNLLPEAKNSLAGKIVVDVKTCLDELNFLEKSVSVSRDAYIGAKSLWWTRPQEEIPTPDGLMERYPPAGEVLYQRYKVHSAQDRELREVRFVWQLMLPNLADDVDNVILFGGPTKCSLFPDYLKKCFGANANKVMSASEVMPPDLNPELTGASLGACYSAKFSADHREHTPLYVNRLPLQVTLEDLQTGEKAEYHPFQHFTAPRIEWQESGAVTYGKNDPFADFVSTETLSEGPEDPISPKRYELTVTDTDGTVLKRVPIGEKLNTRLIGAKRTLVINRYQQVLVAEWSDKSEVALHTVLTDMPGQTEDQRLAYANLQRQNDEDKARENARIERALAELSKDWEPGQPR